LFAESLKQFKFQSFLPRTEIIEALTKVRTDCNRLAEVNIFNTRITKSVRLEEFEQIQTQSFSQEIGFIKDSLILSLKNGIKTSLKDVGKGWFNLQETRMELYEVSKLKKFMNVVKFMMEDSLRFLVMDSLENYTSFLEISASSKVQVNSTSDVTISKTLDRKKFPLFMIDMGILDGKKIIYRTPLSTFEEKLVSLYKNPIGFLQSVPTLERDIMENLIWTHTPMLVWYNTHMEEAVTSIQKRITDAISSALVPITSYLETFNSYKEFLELDIESYINNLKLNKIPLEQYEAEVQAHLRKQEEIEMNIPTSISTGMFLINVGEVKSYLSNKSKSLAVAVLNALVEKGRKNSEKVFFFVENLLIIQDF
jgi:dynein heavy chain